MKNLSIKRYLKWKFENLNSIKIMNYYLNFVICCKIIESHFQKVTSSITKIFSNKLRTSKDKNQLLGLTIRNKKENILIM